MFENLIMGFKISLSLDNLLYCFVGTVLGTIVGVLPGLGPSATIALLLPLTFKLNVTSAIIMLAGIYYGVAYGGSTTSILVNIPGESHSVVTCLDGYQMARQGRAGPALGISAFGSFIGSTVGIIGLMLLAPPLASFALSFGPAEYTALMVGGMTIVTYLSGGSALKAVAMATLGFILSCVGLDPINGAERFTFGTLVLMDGIGIVPIAMGLLGISEVLCMAEGSITQEAGFLTTSWKLRNLMPTKQDWKDSTGPIVRGTILGFFLGIIPGGGAVLSSFLSYGLEKRVSKHPEKFGHGAIEGVAGPETANNSGTAGAFIPLLTLGLPFNSVTALLLAAFIIHGVTPGPMILQKNPLIFWGIVTSMYIANAMLLVQNLPLIGVFVRILKIPYPLLTPLIGLVCFIGSYSLSYNYMDVVILVIFGGAGYLMKKFDFAPAPLILAYIIGPMFERALRQSLILSNGSIAIFFKSPISIALLSIAFLSTLTPSLKMGYRHYREKNGND
jgi:putative tricarboxylic transport membrane protein